VANLSHAEREQAWAEVDQQLGALEGTNGLEMLIAVGLAGPFCKSDGSRRSLAISGQFCK
jgi:hypothetical protein